MKWNDEKTMEFNWRAYDGTYCAVCVLNEMERTELFLSYLNDYARKLLLLMMKAV